MNRILSNARGLRMRSLGVVVDVLQYPLAFFALGPRTPRWSMR